MFFKITEIFTKPILRYYDKGQRLYLKCADLGIARRCRNIPLTVFIAIYSQL